MFFVLRPAWKALALAASILILGAVPPVLAQAPAGPSPRQEIGVEEPSPTPRMIRQQKKELLKSNFQKMKRDADEVAALAKLLQEELDKSSQDILSLQVVSKAEKIEKLAKKIKETARGY